MGRPVCRQGPWLTDSVANRRERVTPTKDDPLVPG